MSINVCGAKTSPGLRLCGGKCICIMNGCKVKRVQCFGDKKNVGNLISGSKNLSGHKFAEHKCVQSIKVSIV